MKPLADEGADDTPPEGVGRPGRREPSTEAVQTQGNRTEATKNTTAASEAIPPTYSPVPLGSLAAVAMVIPPRGAEQTPGKTGF